MAGNSKAKPDILSLLKNRIICGENEVENQVINLILLNFDFILSFCNKTITKKQKLTF
jgi:hypothetical protein